MLLIFQIGVASTEENDYWLDYKLQFGGNIFSFVLTSTIIMKSPQTQGGYQG